MSVPPPDRQPTAPRPLRVLVAFGPTREPIDDVRFIGNRSSGRMGAAIAGAFLRAGAQVTAAVGAGAAAPESSAGQTPRIVHFGTAAELLAVLHAEWPRHDLLVMAAAVADFRPAQALDGKLRRESGTLHLTLEPTQDILASLAATTRPDQYVVGFALERQEELEVSATAKLQRKRADAIVANPLEAMDATDVRARLLLADGRWLAPADGAVVPKTEFAAWLVSVVLPLATARIGARTL